MTERHLDEQRQASDKEIDARRQIAFMEHAIRESQKGVVLAC